MLFSSTPTPAHRAGPGGSSYQLDAQVRISDQRCQESSEPDRETQSTPTDHTGAANQDENSLVGSRRELGWLHAMGSHDSLLFWVSEIGRNHGAR